MIADYLPTRLCWESQRGVARLRGVEVKLTQAPKLEGVDIEAIDWAPGEVAMVMPAREGWRDMTRAEVAAAAALLEQITARVT